MEVIWLAFLLASLACVAHGQGGCDAGWEMYNNNQCYLFKQKFINWKDAQSECNRLDSSLVRVTSSAQLQWMVKTMKAKYQATGFWTGLNDNDKDPSQKLGTGTWKWGSYTPADLTVIQWNTSPANDGQANCAGFNIQSQLADVSCGARQGAVCMMTAGSNGCLDGWQTTYDGSCLYFTNTSDSTQLRTWGASREWCKNKAPGSDLATITTKSQMNAIKVKILYQSQNTKIYWVGLQYKINQWAWLKGGTPDTSVLQWQTEPNNVAGVENCGIVRMTGRFSDRDCTSNANYICTKPVYNWTPTDNIGCGPWIRAGKFCYMFSTGASLNWKNARNRCLKQNADLIKVDSLDKKAWLQYQMQDSASRVYWSGLTDQQTEGTYVWGDGTPFNTTMISWSVEPNNYLGQEQCAVVTYNGGYNDVPCSLYHAAAICEIDNDNQRTCPMGWTSNAGKCYLFSPYNNASLWMNNDEAKSFCTQHNNVQGTTVHLLSITNKQEKAFILKTLAGMSDNAQGWWTSLSDLVMEGYWSFGDGSIPSASDWSSEPSTMKGDNCGMINWGGVFHMRNCANSHPYICERYAFGQSKGFVHSSNPAITLVLTVISFVIIRLS